MPAIIRPEVIKGKKEPENQTREAQRPKPAMKKRERKNEKQKKEKAETENKKGNQANDDGEENPAQFNSMVN